MEDKYAQSTDTSLKLSMLADQTKLKLIITFYKKLTINKIYSKSKPVEK